MKIFLAVLFLLLPSFSSHAEPIRIGFIDYHPIVINNPKGPNGYLVEYVKPIFEKSGLTPNWRQLATHRALIQLQQGQLDTFFTLLQTAERAALVDYSSVPLIHAQSAVCSKPGAIQLPSKKALRIAHFLSTVIPKALQSHDLIPVTPEEVTQRMLTMLEKDRVDAIFYVYPEVLALSLAQTKSDLKLECHVFKEFSMDVYMGYSKLMNIGMRRKLDAALVEQVSAHDFRTYINSLLKEARVKNFHKIDAMARDFELVKSPK